MREDNIQGFGYTEMYEWSSVPDQNNRLGRFVTFDKENPNKITFAHEALDSGLYETLQYPFSYLSGKEELELVEKCKKLDVGFIAMKAMGGGLIKNSKASFAFLNQFDNVLPIWGIQKLEELNEFLSYDENTILTDELKEDIENDKKELGENFCRGCG